MLLNRLRLFWKKLDISNEDKNKLEKISHDINELTTELKKTQKQYQETIDKIYTYKEPFSWNQSSPNPTKDIEHLLDLIDNCIMIGDKYILDQWGIRFLKDKNNYKLAEEITYYKERFENLLENPEEELIAKQEDYIKYLLQNL